MRLADLRIAEAIGDMGAGLSMWRVWVALAHEDIGDQHKRTTLGPLWLLINYLAFAGTFIFIFNRGSGPAYYPAHVATGLLVWFYMMETISLSITLFTREESFIKGTKLPLSIYVLRLALQSVIRAGYAFVGCIVILLMSGTPFTVGWLWAGLGILLILATAPAVIMLFAMLGAFFRDSQFIVSNFMRLGMFLTPVFWVHDGARGIRAVFYYLNPFTYFIEIVRLPILLGTMPWKPFALCLAISATLWLVSFAVFARFRRDVVFVL